MYVYIVRSCYEDNRTGREDYYVEDVFSSITKAEEYIREFDPEDDIYVMDSGIVYHAVPGVNLPRRLFASADYARELSVYCECWEVK